MVYRIFVEKKAGLDNEAKSFLNEAKNLEKRRIMPRTPGWTALAAGTILRRWTATV